MGGLYDLKSFLFSPYPALPPNVVRRLHLHGGRTTVENYPSLLLHSTERHLGDVWVCGFFRAHVLDVCCGRMFRTCGSEDDFCTAGPKTGPRWPKTAPGKCHEWSVVFRTCGAEADVCSARKAPRRPPEDLKAARRRLNMAPARSEDGPKTGPRWPKTAPGKCHE